MPTTAIVSKQPYTTDELINKAIGMNWSLSHKPNSKEHRNKSPNICTHTKKYNEKINCRFLL